MRPGGRIGSGCQTRHGSLRFRAWAVGAGNPGLSAHALPVFPLPEGLEGWDGGAEALRAWGLIAVVLCPAAEACVFSLGAMG